MITVSQWFEAACRKGAVCQDYIRKWSAAGTPYERFRVLCDANGGDWLLTMDARGAALPFESFIREYGRFINNGYAMEYPQGYTSGMYCRYEGGDSVVAGVTLLHLLGCRDMDIVVEPNTYPTILLSRSCGNISIHVCDGARLNIDVYGDAVYSVDGDKSNVTINRKI